MDFSAPIVADLAPDFLKYTLCKLKSLKIDFVGRKIDALLWKTGIRPTAPYLKPKNDSNAATNV